MAAFIQGFYTGLGSVGTGAGSTLRPIGTEQQLWTVHSGGFTAESGNFGHIGERTWTPSQSYRLFNTASSYAMFGFEGRNLPAGSTTLNTATKFGFAGAAQVCSLRIGGNGQMALYLSDSTLVGVTTTAPISSSTTFYTIECAFASTNPISCETRVNGVRLAELTTVDFGAAGGQVAGTMAQAAYASPVQMTHVFVNLNTLASPVLYYWWQKNHSAIWHPVVTGAGASFAEQSDFLGVKKKFQLTPSAVGNYTLVNWANGAGTHPTNIADTSAGTDDDTSYIRNQTDPGGVSAANNRVSHAFTDLPGTATRVGWVQRNIIGKTDQATLGVLARGGARSGGTDYFDNVVTAGICPSFGASYSTGSSSVPNFGTARFYPYPHQDNTVPWTPTTVNAFEGIVEMVDIL